MKLEEGKLTFTLSLSYEARITKETFNSMFHPLYSPYYQEFMYMKGDSERTEFKS